MVEEVNLATLCHDPETQVWSAVFNGKTIARSQGGDSSRDYVIHAVLHGNRSKVLKYKIKGFTNLDSEQFAPSTPTATPVSDAVIRTFTPKVKPNNQLSVKERYELLDECVEMVLNPDSGIRSLIITGEGSLGKTFHTKERIRAHGLISTEEAIKQATSLTPDEQVIANLILERMEEVKEQVIAYYRENPVKIEGSDDEEDSEVEDIVLEFGDVDFVGLHTSGDIKKRACGGTYMPGLNAYQFNIKLAMQNINEFLQIVVPHEIAHHVQHIVFPKAKRVAEGHGKEWKKIMTDVMEIATDRFHTMDTTTVKHAPDLAGDYHYVKGYSSAKGLFRTLYENKKKIVVFDDCDAAWKNEVSANLLKAALDSDDERWVTWNVESMGNDDLPRSFLFEGRVIFISNVASEDFPQPLITRSLRADVELTMDERFERMRQILGSEKFAPGIAMQVKQMSYDFLFENKEIAAEISSRSLLNVIKVANTGSKLWKRIALSNIA